jgi:hypothetical protein
MLTLSILCEPLAEAAFYQIRRQQTTTIKERMERVQRNE